MALKVKVFERVNHAGAIEADMNQWLEQEPGVQIRDMQLSATPIESDRGVPDFAVFCTVLYEE